MRIKSIIAFCTVALIICILCSCDRKNVEITVRNITGVEISELIIKPEISSDNTKNRLEKNLPTDSQIQIKLDRYSEKELRDGYSLYVVNAEDGSDSSFSMLHFENGDTLTFYVDDWGLAVGVNMTDEEVDAQIAEEHEDFLEYIEELDEEETTESTE